jgi:hypothetical protein
VGAGDQAGPKTESLDARDLPATARHSAAIKACPLNESNRGIRREVEGDARASSQPGGGQGIGWQIVLALDSCAVIELNGVSDPRSKVVDGDEQSGSAGLV